ncbi:MAG: molybdate ABC transporter substrate-binding protein [Mycobacteriaceae bacterium]
MKRSLTVIATAVALLLAGCGSGTGGSSGSGTTATAGTTTTAGAAGGDALDGNITVFAAASLKDTFTEIGKSFEAAHPGTTVGFSFAGSSTLVAQITAGAPADVFASANTANMDKLVKAGDASGASVDFATNVLEIATPPGNPKGVESFADLANPAIKTVVCAPQVPCGAATTMIEKATGTTIPAVSEELQVTDVLGKVISGEADAGLVYVTDVKGVGRKVTGVMFPESSKAVNTYPIVAVKGSHAPGTAAAFLAYVRSPAGEKVLRAAGFGAP